MQEWLQYIRKHCRVISDHEYNQLDVDKKKEIDKLIQQDVCQIGTRGQESGIGNRYDRRENVKKFEEYLKILRKMVSVRN